MFKRIRVAMARRRLQKRVDACYASFFKLQKHQQASMRLLGASPAHVRQRLVAEFEDKYDVEY